MRRILVGIKRVIDHAARIRVQEDRKGIELDGVKMSINPFDEIALEEAVRMREAGRVDEVVSVCIGVADCQQQLRTALAMGADRAILVQCNHALESNDVARIFLKLVERETPSVVLLGKQAIDDDHNQTGQMLAALWGRPQATFASRIEMGEISARVTREVDAGLETLDIDLPAVFTTDLRLNEPRYVKLPEIMKAKKKPLSIVTLAELGIVPRQRMKQLHCEPPPVRQAGRMVRDAAELIAALRERGVLA